MHNYSRSLIPSVVAADTFELAVTNAFIRLHSDKGPNLHPNGVSKDCLSCLSHKNIETVNCKDIGLLVSAPPLGKRKKQDGHQLGIVSVFQWSLTVVILMTLQR